MKLAILSEGIKVDKEKRSSINLKINKLNKYLNENGDTKILIKKIKDRYKVEITVLSEDEMIVKSEAIDEDFNFWLFYWQ